MTSRQSYIWAINGSLSFVHSKNDLYFLSRETPSLEEVVTVDISKWVPLSSTVCSISPLYFSTHLFPEFHLHDHWFHSLVYKINKNAKNFTPTVLCANSEGEKFFNHIDYFNTFFGHENSVKYKNLIDWRLLRESERVIDASVEGINADLGS